MLHSPSFRFFAPAIVLGCRHRRSVTCQLLHCHDIDSSIEEVRAKRAAEIVGRERIDSGEERPSLHNLQDTIVRHPPKLNFSSLADGKKQRARFLSSQIEPLFYQGDRRSWEINCSVFLALTLSNFQRSRR